MARPKGSFGRYKPKRTRTTIAIENDVLEALDKACKQEGVLRPDLVNAILRDKFKVEQDGLLEKPEAA